MPFEFPQNQMSGKFAFSATAERIELVHGQLCDMIWSHEATKFLTPSMQKCDDSLSFILSFVEKQPYSFLAVITGPGTL
jgi:hypothetical protein